MQPCYDECLDSLFKLQSYEATDRWEDCITSESYLY